MAQHFKTTITYQDGRVRKFRALFAVAADRTDRGLWLLNMDDHGQTVHIPQSLIQSVEMKISETDSPAGTTPTGE